MAELGCKVHSRGGEGIEIAWIPPASDTVAKLAHSVISSRLVFGPVLGHTGILWKNHGSIRASEDTVRQIKSKLLQISRRVIAIPNATSDCSGDASQNRDARGQAYARRSSQELRSGSL